MKTGLLILVLCVLEFVAFAQQNTPKYSFFAAGHTYGSPLSPQYGLHPPFVNYIPTLNNQPTITMGFLTGDVVVSSTDEYWKAAEKDIDLLDMPVHIAAGNHDLGAEFSKRYQHYYDFVYEGDLFIVLTPGLNLWNIKNEQLEFLEKSLVSHASEVNHVFIFMHELIWWSPDNQYKDVKINFEPHYPGSTNYLEVVKPLLQSYDNEFTLYAGDVGATKQVSTHMYAKEGNITLIASGMGATSVRDNIVLTHVYENLVEHELVSIYGWNPNALGALEDQPRYGPNEATPTSIGMFPNPANGSLRIENTSGEELVLCITSIAGVLMQQVVIGSESRQLLDVSVLAPGVYNVILKGERTYQSKRLIIVNE